ncbi:MAG: T9SS type A sorting domain-containing protein [Bacteroidota bacterium]
MKYTISTAGNDPVSLWVFSSGIPADESSAGTAEATSSTTAGTNVVDAIALRQGSATTSSAVIVDGIRVGSSWNIAPLPVELTSFTAIAKGRGVELAWKTATEVNNHGFEIQRSEVRGQTSAVSWAKVGFVEGAGNSNAAKEYSFTDKVPVSGKYLYRLKQVDNDGKFEYSSSVEVNASTLVSGYELAQNHPNPFNPTTNIAFALAKDEFVSLKVYDMLGKEIATLVNNKQSAGAYTVPFNASAYPSGIYFYTLRAGNSAETKKMLLVK